MRLYILLIFFIIIISIFFTWQGIYLPKSFVSGQEKIFPIEKGQSFLEISEDLEKEGLIQNRIPCIIYLFLTGRYKKLQAGEYSLSSSMTVPEIVEIVVSGNVTKEKITIIEGWSLRDIGCYLENRGMFQAEELFELVGFPLADYSKTTDLPKPKDFSQEFDFLKDRPKNLGLEGYLFPDTYEIKDEESLEDIIKKMLNNFNQKLTNDLREEIKRQNKSIFEVIIMASMIEKEVRTLEDKKLVSGILWKRLENNMQLQVDATITYITGKKTVKITLDDLKIDSPYNTYKYRGLPAGPVCNPGLESIQASLYPKESEYWFYLSTPEGETIFSKTLEEHRVAKDKYLK